MIDPKQYEIWFVTGSQHLYGPQTLETVAEHSRAIATHLDMSAHGDREFGFVGSRMRLERKVVVGHWIEFLRINASTQVNAFKDTLRWNDLSYLLRKGI